MTFDEGSMFGIEIEFIPNEGVTANDIAFEVRQEGIECSDQSERYYHSVEETEWHIKYDASVTPRGLEMVSPPMSGRGAFEEIARVCAVLQEHGSINKTCGLHVHHEVRRATGGMLRSLCMLAMRSSQWLRHCMPPSRRRNEYCLQLPATYATALKREPERRALDQLFVTDRRSEVNFQSYSIRRTVEFRLHSGTLSARKIQSWVAFTQAMVQTARRKTYYVAVPFRTLREMLDELDLSTTTDPIMQQGREYIRERFDKFATRRGHSECEVYMGFPAEMRAGVGVFDRDDGDEEHPEVEHTVDRNTDESVEEFVGGVRARTEDRLTQMGDSMRAEYRRDALRRTTGYNETEVF